MAWHHEHYQIGRPKISGFTPDILSAYLNSVKVSQSNAPRGPGTMPVCMDQTYFITTIPTKVTTEGIDLVVEARHTGDGDCIVLSATSDNGSFKSEKSRLHFLLRKALEEADQPRGVR